MKKYILLLAIMLSGIVIGWLCRMSYSHRTAPIVQRDTIVRYDTLHYSKLELKGKTYKIDVPKIGIPAMVLYPIDKVDTVYKDKKVYIAMEREYRCTEMEGVEIFHSGIDSTIDSLNVITRSVEIVESYIPRENKNSIGIGVEASYLNTASIPIYLEYTRLLHKNFEIYGRVGYDLPTRTWGAGVGVKAHLSF